MSSAAVRVCLRACIVGRVSFFYAACDVQLWHPLDARGERYLLWLVLLCGPIPAAFRLAIAPTCLHRNDSADAQVKVVRF